MGCSGSKQQEKGVATGNTTVPRRLLKKETRSSSKSKKPAVVAADGGSKEAAAAKADDQARITSSDEFYSSRRDMESLDAVSEGAEYYSPSEVDSDLQHASNKIASAGRNGEDKAAAGSSLEAHGGAVRSEAQEEEKEEIKKEITMSTTTRHNYVESIGSNGSMEFKEAISMEEIEAEIVVVSEK